MMRHYFLYIYFLIIVSCTDQDNNEIKEAKSDSLLIVASQTDSLIVENPQSVSKKIPLDDSSYFRIKISSDNKYTISFYPDSLVSAQISLVDSFISNHINRIAQEKILVTVDRNAKKEMVKDLNNLFRKYKIYKFRITTIPDVY